MISRNQLIEQLIPALRETVAGFAPPMTQAIIDEFGKAPYLILISCLLSLRARDVVTIHVCRDLFSRVTTPSQLLALPQEELEKIIFRSGYYKTKAQTLRTVSALILEKYNGAVPATAEELLKLPGVGIKTANLVLGLAFDIPAICVDTHVHRISNIYGIVQTQTPEQTEEALRKVLPKKYWIEWNTLLVMLGQNMCTPPTPKCSQCPVADLCPQIGVLKSR